MSYPNFNSSGFLSEDEGGVSRNSGSGYSPLPSKTNFEDNDDEYSLNHINPFDDSSSQVHTKTHSFTSNQERINSLPKLAVEAFSFDTSNMRRRFNDQDNHEYTGYENEEDDPLDDSGKGKESLSPTTSFDYNDEEKLFAYKRYSDYLSPADPNNPNEEKRNTALVFDLVQDKDVWNEAIGTGFSDGSWLPNKTKKNNKNGLSLTIPTDINLVNDDDEDDEGYLEQSKGDIKLTNIPIRTPIDDPSLEFLSPRNPSPYYKKSRDTSFSSNLEEGMYGTHPNNSTQSVNSTGSNIPRKLTVAFNKFSNRVVRGDEGDIMQKRLSQINNSNISILNDENGVSDLSKPTVKQEDATVINNEIPHSRGSSFSYSTSRRPSITTQTISIPEMTFFNGADRLNIPGPERLNIPDRPSMDRLSSEFDETDSKYIRDAYSGDYNRALGIYGKSLKLFGPYNFVRVSIARFLDSTPVIIILIIYILHAVLLGKQVWNPPITDSHSLDKGMGWTDIFILAFNIFFTVEIAFKIISYGLYDNSEFYKQFNLEKKQTFLEKLIKKIEYLFQTKGAIQEEEKQVKKLVHSFTIAPKVVLPKSELDNLKDPFLLSHWNIIDLVSCICYWISLIIKLTGVDKKHTSYIIKALGTIRIFRLMRLAEGTFTIVHSLNHAIPQLANICLFILYFWVLLSIAGVQTFKSSFQRQCVYTDPQNSSLTYINQDNYQFCGAWLDPDTGVAKPYLYADNEPSEAIKGYYCPRYSQCIVGENPYSGTVSFDNIFHSLELVYVVISMNTFTDLMYYCMDAENMAGSIFFIVSIFLVSIWLMNIFVAVIVSSFKVTTEAQVNGENKPPQGVFNSFFLSKLRAKGLPNAVLARLNEYHKFELFWVLLIIADIISQAVRTDSNSHRTSDIIETIEFVVTYILLIECFVRFMMYTPHWRYFFSFKRNVFDLILAIVTSVIVITPIRKALGQVYYWLTVFQLARFYRVVISVKFVRDLWLDVIGNFRTIFNLTLFYFLSLTLYSIVTSSFFENLISHSDTENQGFQFALNTLPNTFLGLYVITTTENWTEILYLVQSYGLTSFYRACSAIILIGWFLFSNSILLNIFIAVIAENMEVDEFQKKNEQVRAFIRTMATNLYKTEESFMSNLKKRFKRRKGKANNSSVKDVPSNIPEIFSLLMAGTIVDTFLDEELKEKELSNNAKLHIDFFINRDLMAKFRRVWSRWTKFYTGNPFYAKRQREIEDSINPNVLAKNILMEDKIITARQRKYIEEHPSYNTVLFIFAPANRIRRFCQMLVAPAFGERIGGRPPEKHLQDIFSGIMLIGTVGIVVLACYATPLYTQSHDVNNTIWFWTLYADLAFALLFLLEAIVKVIADGLLYTPNAIIRSPWNVIDMIVLITLWLNLILFVKGDGSASRIVRGFKAFRALRLLTISDTAKKTFHRIIIAGFGKILGAAAVSFCLLFPFSIWGLNIFNGRLGVCNDSSLSKSECYGEYESSVFDWDVVAPRVYQPPYLYFDSFPHSFSSLFQITSLEGWVDLLGFVTQSTGKGTPPALYAQPYNAVFLVIYMFVAMIFILNLFVSVIISNYSRTSGSAYLTTEQKSWNEVEKLLKQVNPTRRPSKQELGPFKLFLNGLVIEKNRFWGLIYDSFLFIQLVILLMEASDNSETMGYFRNGVLLFTAVFFTINSLARQFVKGFKIFNKWDYYQLIVSFCSLVFQIVLSITLKSPRNIVPNIAKAFALLILTFIIQRSNRLSLLLRFASASIPSLLSLLYTWIILFLVYAIALNQIFGLTKIGPNGNGNLNVRTVTKSLLMLFKMSFGEGWNSMMNDYYLEEPYCSVYAEYSDCGNIVYAHILFISWNVISMYIFLNLFISLVVENFSYAYHRSGPCSLITRQEIRKFKDCWREFDPEATGFIPLDRFYLFLHSLNGVLSFKLYDGRLSIKNLSENWFTKSDRIGIDGKPDPYALDIDFDAMYSTLDSIDVHKVRHRKAQFERFVEEVIFDMEVNNHPGVSFTKILMQIPLYTQFQDGACLSLRGFLERHILLKELDSRIAKKKRYYARKTFVDRWRFLNYLKEKRSHEREDQAPIEIIIN